MLLFIVKNTKTAIKLPVIVIGTPVNTPSNVDVLYLASLYAPQIGKAKSTVIPIIPAGPTFAKSYIKNVNIEGPKRN